MKVIIADTVEVAPKEGTIIRFEDRGLVVIGIYVGTMTTRLSLTEKAGM